MRVALLRLNNREAMTAIKQNVVGNIGLAALAQAFKATSGDLKLARDAAFRHHAPASGFQGGVYQLCTCFSRVYRPSNQDPIKKCGWRPHNITH
jgi:hypothetical protein